VGCKNKDGEKMVRLKTGTFAMGLQPRGKRERGEGGGADILRKRKKEQNNGFFIFLLSKIFQKGK